MTEDEAKPARYHTLIRTSPKGPGQPFIGTCTQCGKTNLPGSAVWDECENIRGISKEQALAELLEGDDGK